MMRRRGRRRRAAWSYADSFILDINSASPNAVVSQWLLPPARAQYLADARQKDRITFVGAHLWFDFFWKNTSGAQQQIPDVDWAIFKSTIADPAASTPDQSPIFGQWDQPPTPAAFTSWEEDSDDGGYPFLWQHHIKGFSPPNAMVGTYSESDPEAVNNQIDRIQTGTSDFVKYVCRKFSVTQEWQPDVVIRSKRRLFKGEGILLAGIMPAGAPPSGLSCQLDVRVRVLTM